MLKDDLVEALKEVSEELEKALRIGEADRISRVKKSLLRPKIEIPNGDHLNVYKFIKKINEVIEVDSPKLDALEKQCELASQPHLRK